MRQIEAEEMTMLEEVRVRCVYAQKQRNKASTLAHAQIILYTSNKATPLESLLGRVRAKRALRHATHRSPHTYTCRLYGYLSVYMYIACVCSRRGPKGFWLRLCETSKPRGWRRFVRQACTQKERNKALTLAHAQTIHLISN